MKEASRFLLLPVLILGIPVALPFSNPLLAMPQSEKPAASTPAEGKGGIQGKPAARRPVRAVEPPAQQAYGRLPLQFEENRGQTDARVKYLARGNGYVFFLTPTESVLALRQRLGPVAPEGIRQLPNGRGGAGDPSQYRWSETVVHIELAGANPNSGMEAQERLRGISNYFIGNDPAKWRAGIPNYARVVSRNVYPGIDAAYYGKEGRVESDFIVAPGRDPGAIRFKIRGAKRVEVNSEGELVLETAAGDVKFQKPVLYQTVEGKRQEVEGGYRLMGKNEAGFVVGAYEHGLPLVIDPTLVYSTYLGGSGLIGDAANAIAVDATGAAYITGFTTSADFPLANAHQGALGGMTAQNAFVSKLAANGASLIFSTYLGGSGTDTGFGIAVDTAGEPYVTGSTSSPDFPKTSGTGLNGGLAAFVSKLSANGSALMFSIYLSGNASDQGNAIAVDASGNAYVAGDTFSNMNFPVTPGVFQGVLVGVQNAFVAKISAAGAVTWATYLGGEAFDFGLGIAVNSANPADVFVTGSTNSARFPTQAPIQANLGGATATNAFVTELNPTGTMLVYSTYLGGSNDDGGVGIAVDSGGDAVVAGVSFSEDFPLVAPLQAHDSFSADAFVTKVAAGGGSFVFSTVFGGPNGSQSKARAMALDPSGNIYIAGSTSNILLPTLDPMQGPAAMGGACECGTGSASETGMIVEFKGDGSDYLFSSYFGGSSNNFSSVDETVDGIAVDGTGNVYIAGSAGSTDFPTVGPFQAALKSRRSNAFVAKISPATPAGPQLFPTALTLQTFSLGSNTGPSIVTLMNGTNTLTISGITFSGANAADFSETDSCGPELVPHAVCAISISAAPAVSATETATLNIMDSDASSPQLVPLTANVVTPVTPPPPPTGILVVSPLPSLPAFAPQELGTVSAGQLLTLSNTGAVPVSASVSPPFEFGTTGGGTCTGTFFVVVAAGTSCTVAIDFVPSSVGFNSGTLFVSGNFTGSPTSVGVSGTGFQFAVLNPTFLVFSSASTPPPQVVGTPSGTLSTFLFNMSTTTTLTGITPSISPAGLGYAIVSNTCGATLRPGLNCSIGITYTPTTAGQIDASLLISDSDAVNPQIASLFGYALNTQPTLGPIFPTSINFGPIPIGSSKLNFIGPQDLGNAPLAIAESIQAVGSNPAPGDYSAVDSCAGVIPAGGFCSITVTFTPSAVGLRTASVKFTSSTAGALGVPQTVTLIGSGSSPTTAAAVPATVTFPSTLMGATSAPQFATFTNTGTRPLVYTAVPAISGADPFDFSFTFPTGITGCRNESSGAIYNPQIACPISITFTPTATGPRTGTLVITDTASNSPQVITLQGNGANGSVNTITPNPLSFGNQPVGTASGAMTLMFSNATGTAALTVTGLMVTGTNASDFTQVAGGGTCGALPITVPVGAGCTVQFMFTPTTATNEMATLMVIDSTVSSPQPVTLMGTGTQPAVTLNPSAAVGVAFGSVTVMTPSAAKTVTLTNTGNGPLNFTAAPSIAGPTDFAITGTTCAVGTPVAPGGGLCTVTMVFTPTTATMENATLNFADNAVPANQSVPLTGTGRLPTVMFTPTAAMGVNFGAVTPMTTSPPMMETVTVGAGTGTLQLTSITIVPTVTGTGPNDFAFAAGTTCPTGGGAVTTSCVVMLTFTPSMGAAEGANLVFTGTDLAGSPVAIPLSGVGASTAAGFTFTPMTPQGGGSGTVVSILPGDTAKFTIVVQPNPGFIGTIMISCVSGIPATIATASPTTVNVTTSPSPPIAVSCTLQTNCVAVLVGPRQPWSAPPWTPGPLEAVLLAALLAASLWPRRGTDERTGLARRMAPVCGLLLVAVLVMTWAGCVSNPKPLLPNAPTTPAGVYQIQLVGTAAGGVKTVLPLTVHVI